MANTNRSGSWALGVLIALISLACAALFLTLLLPIGRTVGAALPAPPPEERVRTALAITPDFDRSIRNLSAAAMEGLLPIPKSYRLAEDLVVAPAPDPAGFGASRDPADSADVLAAAAVLLDGQDTLWRTDMPIMAGTDVRWYLDDTIFAIAWKQGIGSSCYSFSEVKIADASQFRRYLADDSFSSQVQHLPTEMARSVNAVTALSGSGPAFFAYVMEAMAAAVKAKFDGQVLSWQKWPSSLIAQMKLYVHQTLTLNSFKDSVEKKGKLKGSADAREEKGWAFSVILTDHAMHGYVPKVPESDVEAPEGVDAL